MTVETNAKPTTMPWSEQNSLGRSIAIDGVTRCQGERNPTLLLRCFDSQVKDAPRGVAVGFFQQLAEHLIQR